MVPRKQTNTIAQQIYSHIKQFSHSAMRLSQRRSTLWWADVIASKYQQRRRASHTRNMEGVRGLRFHLVTITSARCSFPLNIWHRTRIGTFGVVPSFNQRQSSSTGKFFSSSLRLGGLRCLVVVDLLLCASDGVPLYLCGLATERLIVPHLWPASTVVAVVGRVSWY